jgi:hypothetical protein
MIDFGAPNPNGNKLSTMHVSLAAASVIGGVFGAIAFVSGYVSGILTMRDNIAAQRADMAAIRVDMEATKTHVSDVDGRLARLSDKFDAFVAGFNDWKLRAGTKQ